MFVNDMLRSFFATRPTRRNRFTIADSPRLTEQLENRQLLTLIGMNVDISQSVDTSTATTNNSAPTLPVSATATELTSFANTFDIDIRSSAIAMNFNYTGPANADPSGVVPAGTLHRYTFAFDTASNETISATASTTATLVPNVTVQNGDTVVVELTPGMQLGNGFDAVINVDVNRPSTSITGRKFHDVNRNSVRDSDEPWLSGWQVQLLDINQNSSVVDTVTTDANGVYEFANVPGSTYLLNEVLQEGWEQTTPTTPDDAAAFNFDRDFELRQANSDFLNWGGRQERWLFGNGSWYFITPDGAFHRWDGSPSSNLTGELLHTFDPSFYNNLTKLTNAPSPRQYIVDVDGATPQTFRGLHFGNYFAPPSFTIVNNDDNGANNNTATINWIQSAGQTYDLWISNLGTRTRVPVPADLTGGTYTTDELPDGRYRVWLQSRNSSDILSPWSRGYDFEFTRAALTDPIIDGLNAGIDRTPTLDIAPVTDAASYDIEVTNESGRVVYRGNGGASQRVDRELPLGTYGVAVRANYTDGSRNEYSAPQTLIIDGRPRVNAVNGTLSWSPINAATEYDIWIDRLDADGNREDIQIVRIQDLRDTILTPNLPRGDYAVWVRAIRSEGGVRHASFWSFRLDFRVTEASEDNNDELLNADESLLAFAEGRREAKSETSAKATNQQDEATSESETNKPAAGSEESVVAVMMEIATSGIVES